MDLKHSSSLERSEVIPMLNVHGSLNPAKINVYIKRNITFQDINSRKQSILN